MPSVKLTLRLKVGKPEAGWIIHGRMQRRFYIPPGNKTRERDRRFYPSFTWCSTFLRSLENGSKQVRLQVTPATNGQHAAEPAWAAMTTETGFQGDLRLGGQASQGWHVGGGDCRSPGQGTNLFLSTRGEAAAELHRGGPKVLCLGACRDGRKARTWGLPGALETQQNLSTTTSHLNTARQTGPGTDAPHNPSFTAGNLTRSRGDNINEASSWRRECRKYSYTVFQLVITNAKQNKNTKTFISKVCPLGYERQNIKVNRFKSPVLNPMSLRTPGS